MQRSNNTQIKRINSYNVHQLIGAVLVLGLMMAMGRVTLAGEAPRVLGELTIFAAASLTDAFKEMATQIEQANPGTKLTFNFAGSPTLRTQMAQGARADVFASADEPNMAGAEKDGPLRFDRRFRAEFTGCGRSCQEPSGYSDFAGFGQTQHQARSHQ